MLLHIPLIFTISQAERVIFGNGARFYGGQRLPFARLASSCSATRGRGVLGGQLGGCVVSVNVLNCLAEGYTSVIAWLRGLGGRRRLEQVGVSIGSRSRVLDRSC